MKKTTFVFILLALTINIFANDFSISAGAGGFLGYSFSRYTLEGGNLSSAQSMDRFDFGGFVFADFTYAEFSVIIQGGRNSYSENMVVVNSTLTDANGIGQEISLGFSLLGKYPLRINEKLIWFPLLGIEYHIALQQLRKPDGDLVYNRSKGHLIEDRDANNEPYPLYAWNSLWIDIGAGMDYFLGENLFLRGELLFGFRLPTIYEMGALEVVEKQMGISNPRLAGLTGSPALKIGIGYRF